MSKSKEEESAALNKIKPVKNVDLNQNSAEHGDNKLCSIAFSENLGRYLVASKDIQAGEMIINNEQPLVIGPVQQSEPLCLGCYNKLKNVNNFRCYKCKWPICQADCSGLYQPYGHTIEECIFLLQLSFDTELQNDKINIYNLIVPLRCFLLKNTTPVKWKKIVSMEPHNKIRKNIKSIWELNEMTVVNKLKKHFDPLEIHTICGVLEVNSFEVTTNDISLRALFPLAYLMSHDCVPNTMHTNDDNFNLQVRASIPIPKGYPITISYAYTLQGTAARRTHIKETKFFDCTCKRCSDPSEVGTNISTVMCPTCNKPTLMSSSPLNSTAPWICKTKKCTRYSVSPSYIDDLVRKFEDDLKIIPENDIHSYENWIKKVLFSLHQNHYLILGVKYTLCLLYGKIPGFMIQNMNDDLLKRKLNICEQLLKIANIIQPGQSRLRGIILYELHAPVMILLQKTISRPLSRKVLRYSMQRVISCLTEASEILKFESPNTMEGKIGLAAQKALITTSQWEKTLGKF